VLRRATISQSDHALIDKGRKFVTVFRSGEAPPHWCELTAFYIHDLGIDEVVSCSPEHGRERLLVTNGTCQIQVDGGSQVLKEAQFADVPAETSYTVVGKSEGAQAVRLIGRWKNELGGCGVFRVQNTPDWTNKGDPVSYPKLTSVDSHYHDCDEYWILLDGAGEAVVGKNHFPMRRGDCLAIGMGHHHDFPNAVEPIKAVFFETSLEGEKRVGHLWQHTHGPAHAKPERT
jgi:mannose-6-phosphate isomerase-like protein (cupin superfamily)